MNLPHVRSISKRCIGAFTVAAIVLTPLAVLGVADPTPTQHYTAASFGGPLRAAVAASDGSFYVAGTFIVGAVSYGNAVLASASTGLSESPFPDVDGDVYVTISDEDDGWYIGGNFNRVGSLQRTGMAHILPNGTPDADFNADIVLGLGDAVYSLAIWDEVNPTLFVGGNFSGTTFSGVPVTGMVALDAVDGSLADGFSQPQISGGSETVYALTVDDGGFVYVGGDFNTIGNATSRNYLVGFDAATGATTSFDPDMDNTVNALAITGDGGTLYAGGDFTFSNGTESRNGIAAFETSLGVVDGDFNPDANDPVYTLALDEANDLLYMGGIFTSVNVATPRNHLAAVDTEFGVAEPFDPDLSHDVFSIALTTDGSTLYAVGPFTEVNVTADPTIRDGVAAFDTDVDPTDNVIDGFSQSMEHDPYFISLNDNETSVLIGASGGPQHRADQSTVGVGLGIIHVLSDGSMDPAFFNPVSNGTTWSLALSPDETTLYAGGDFTEFNGVDRNRIAAFDADTGVMTDFDPDLNAVVNALAVSSDGGTLYAGGEFTVVNQTADPVTRNYLAAFDTAIDLDNATTFDPDMDLYVNALALTDDDGTLYAGGSFSSVNSLATARDNLAAFDTGTAIATAFNPGPNDTVRALALSDDESLLYAGGNFEDAIDPICGDHAASFNTATSLSTDSFCPDPNNTVLALALGPDGVLYMGGNFSAVDGDDHNFIAAVSADTGTPESGFDANLDGSVNALAHGGTDIGLLAVGGFSTSFQDPGGSEIPYVVTIGLAHFPDSSTPAPTPTPSSGNRTGGYWVGFSQPPAPGRGDPANLARYGLREGDTISTDGSPGDSGFDPDIYIVNEHGYKRLFLNPAIFGFYGHLGGFATVRQVPPIGRDAFPTSGLFRNCEANDPKVYAVEVTGEDIGILHHVQMSGDAVVAQDSEFFKKVFCINNNEFNWYLKSPTPYTSLGQVPVYHRPGQ